MIERIARMGGDNQRYLGWVLVSLSAVAWSTAGFFDSLNH